MKQLQFYASRYPQFDVQPLPRFTVVTANCSLRFGWAAAFRPPPPRPPCPEERVVELGDGRPEGMGR